MNGKHRTPSSVPGLHRFPGAGRHRRWLPATVRAHRKLTASVVALLLGAGVTSIVLTQATSPVAAAQAACTPDAGYTGCARFTNSGADQSFTLPAGADPSNVLVKVWGAGAGGNNQPSGTGGFSSGGSGGYASGVVSTTPGATFAVMVGSGGAYDGQTPSNAYGFAGEGGATTAQGSGGGGLSGVFLGRAAVAPTSTARAVVIAGGGGGGGGRPCGPCYSLGGQGGGAFSGGQPTMQGQNDDYATSGIEGGGGGGGYAGGIANQSRLTSNALQDLNGEGGSNYIGGLVGAAVSGGVSSASPEYTTAVVASNDGSNPPNATDAQYVAGVGIGKPLVGAGAAAGGNGLVVFEYKSSPTITIRKISNGGVGTFNFTGTNGIAPTALTTTAAGTAVSSSVMALSASSTATTITEAAAAGFTLAASSTPCTGMGPGGTATLNAATGVLTLNAAATASNAAIVCTFSNNLASALDLSITKTDNVTGYSASQLVTYTIVVSSAADSGSAADGALVRDPLPTNMTAFATPSCTATGGAVCPSAMTGATFASPGVTVPTFPISSSLTFTVVGTVKAAPSGNLVNAATLTPPSGKTSTGSACSAPSTFVSATGACTSTDTDTSNTAAPTVQLAKSLVNGSTNTIGFTVSGATPTTDSIAGVPGTTVVGANHTGTANTAVTLTENSATGAALSSYLTATSCVDQNAPFTGNAPITSNSTLAATIPATQMKAGAAWLCTFTNTAQGYLTVQKQSVSEDVNQPFTFSVSPTAGSTSSFTLNDLANSTPTTANGIANPKDLGVSFDPGRTTLYAIAGNAATDGCGGVAADGCIYYRSPGTSTWVMVPGVSGLNIHGAATANTFFYTFTATDSGGTDLDEVDIAELTFTGAGTGPDVSGCADEIGALVPGQSGKCTATYTVTAADIVADKAITNTAQATGTPPNDPPVTSNVATATVKDSPIVALAFTGAPQIGQDLLVVVLLISLGGAFMLAADKYRRRRARS